MERVKKTKLFFAWLNFHLSFWTHPNKYEYRIQLYFEYLNLKNKIDINDFNALNLLNHWEISFAKKEFMKKYIEQQNDLV